jgi:predicted nucleic acid-binding protein
MATADAEAVFLDTNVLIYANVAESPFHQIALRAVESRARAGVELWISRQVLREYLAVLTRRVFLKQCQNSGCLD